MNADEATKMTEFALSPMSPNCTEFLEYADEQIEKAAKNGARKVDVYCLYPKWSEVADILVIHYNVRGFHARRFGFFLRLFNVDGLKISWPGAAPSCR